MKITIQQILLLILLPYSVCFAEPSESQLFKIPAENLRTQPIAFPNVWKYHPGANPLWKNPGFDDHAWANVDAYWLRSPDLSAKNWSGQGWFRFHFLIDVTLKAQKINLRIRQAGKALVFLNGKLVARFEDELRNFMPITLPDTSEMILAIKYTNHNLHKFQKAQFPGGFSLQFEPLSHSTIHFESRQIQLKLQIFFSTFAIVFGLLYLIFYFFLPWTKGNLSFAIFLLLSGIAVFADIQASELTDHLNQALFYSRVHCFIWPLCGLFFLKFVYENLLRKLPRQFGQFPVLSAH